MPVLRYFGWIGSFLLALLFVASWLFPEPIAHASVSDVPLRDKIVIRIHSDHKWPEKVVLDTAMATPPFRTETNSEVASQAETFSARTGIAHLAGLHPAAVPASLTKGNTIHLPAR